MNVERIQEFLEDASRNGWRSLVVFIGSLNELDKLLEKVDVNPNLCILREKDIDITNCREKKNFLEAHRLLGAEYDSVLLSLIGTIGWPGNLLALSFEYVRRRGSFILHIPEEFLSRRFTRYFLNVIRGLCNVAVIREDNVEYMDICQEKPVIPEKPKPLSNDKIVRRLEELCINEEQARIVRGYPGFLYSRDKLFLIHGDRGRGKSSVMGLLAAYTMTRRKGRFTITSRSIPGVQSFYRLLIKALKQLGENPVVEENSKGYITRVFIRGSSIEYVEPWKIKDPEPPLFIDEAAGVGVARIRRWYNRVGKLAASTTIHGYEGSGRVLLKIVKEYFHRTKMYRLIYPVRYYPGDPLEKILYRVFHLDAEPLDKDRVVEPLKYRVYKPSDLADNYELLRSIYGLLVTAHYRNEPDDLVLLLDTDLFKIHVLIDVDGDAVAVAQTRIEEIVSTNAEELTSRGYRLVDKLARYTLLEEALGKRVLRIARIAVTPRLQHRGIGSRLLALIEDEAKKNRFDGVGAIFSGFDTIRFWIRNNYLPFYISPRFNKVTGEKNIAVIKPLNREFREIIDKAVNMFLHYIWFTSHIFYRDLASEKLSMIIKYLREKGYNGIIDKKYMYKRIEKVLSNEIPLDTVLDIVIHHVDKIRVEELNDTEQLVFTARILQGKTIPEITEILHKPINKTTQIYQETIRKVLEKLRQEWTNVDH